jgi:hypothetical protein
MAELTAKLSATPSDELIAKAASIVTLEPDARGRIITLAKPGVLAQYRIVEVLGDSAANQVYMGMVLPLLFVTAIDGDPIFAPKSKLEVEALIQRLDEDGIDAVMKGVTEHYGAPDPEADRVALEKQ